MSIKETIYQAVADLPPYKEGVYFKGVGKDRQGSLNLWLGKFPIQSVRDKLKAVFGFNDPEAEAIYGNDAIQGLIREISRWEQGGTITICPELSTIFNGADDLSSSLSVEKQIKYLEELLHRHNPKAEITIRVLGEVEEHKELLRFLDQFNTEDTEKFNVASFESFVLNTPFSLENIDLKTSNGIFKALYLASREPEEQSAKLVSLLDACQTRHYQDDHAGWFYGLTEVAIRMHELAIGGQNNQGGVYLQGKYDAVIDYVKTASDAPERSNRTTNKYVLALKAALFPKRTPFGKVYVHPSNETKKSYDRAKSLQIAARRRIVSTLSATGILLGMGTTGVVKLDQYIDEQRQEDRIDLMYTLLDSDIKRNKVLFSYDAGGLYIPEDQLPGFTKKMVDQFITELRLRYTELDRVSSEHLEEMMLAVILRDVDRKYVNKNRKHATYSAARNNPDWNYIPDDDLKALVEYPGAEEKEIYYPDLSSINSPYFTAGDDLSRWVDYFVYAHKLDWERVFQISSIGEPYDHLFDPLPSAGGQYSFRHSEGEFCSTEPERRCYYVEFDDNPFLVIKAKPLDDDTSEMSTETGELSNVLYQRSLLRFRASFYGEVYRHIDAVVDGKDDYPTVDPIAPKDMSKYFSWPLRDYTSLSDGQTYKMSAYLIQRRSESSYYWEGVMLLAKPKIPKNELEAGFSSATAERLMPEINLGAHWLSSCDDLEKEIKWGYPKPNTCEYLWPEHLRLDYETEWPFMYVAARSSQTAGSEVEQD